MGAITTLEEFQRRVRQLAQLHVSIAASDPKLARGIVWCRTCGRKRKVDAAACLRSGWPTCCGATMSLDQPDPLDVAKRGGPQT